MPSIIAYKGFRKKPKEAEVLKVKERKGVKTEEAHEQTNRNIVINGMDKQKAYI